MPGHFAVLRSNLYIYSIPSYILVRLVSLDSQKNESIVWMRSSGYVRGLIGKVT